MVLERYEGKELKETLKITGINDNHNTLRVVNEHGETQGLRLNAIDSQYRLYTGMTISRLRCVNSRTTVWPPEKEP
ncbi:Uncharacterised protein [Klebsiella pneumoniae]|nr:hypothetical protein [Klebsiella pneumoniae]STU43901.1 Uncharacterised protein [Klebsiella pneumoniae]